MNDFSPLPEASQGMTMEDPMLGALYESIQNDSLRDIAIFTIIAAAVLGYIIEKLYVFRQTRRITAGSPDGKRTAAAGLMKDVVLADAAHKMILKEDEDGIPILLSMARTGRSIASELKTMNKNLIELTNHNTEFLANFKRDILDRIDEKK